LTGFALLYFGWLIETQDYKRKLASLEESLTIYRELGFISGIIEALKQLGALAIREGNFELAHLRLDEGLSILQEHASILGNSITMSYDLGDLAYYEHKSITRIVCPGPARNICHFLKLGPMPGWAIYIHGLGKEKMRDCITERR
jgi:tetratricopeptide (TPR) repeat protein